jgi:esterase/lipase
MLSNLSASLNESIINYPISDSSLPFSEYISRSRAIIEERRTDLETNANSTLILEANSPFELVPEKPITSGKRIKYGVLLIHGLLDCPFSLRDIGKQLQNSGMLCRAIVLPGHGTTPADLLSISYHDWIQALRYGVDSLKKDVEHIFLAGYSTGAALSVYQALQDSQISGIILLAPAIRIKAPVDIVVSWHYMRKWFSSSNMWLYTEKEIDYAKYLSIPFNPVTQVAILTRVLRELRQHHDLDCPVFMAVSREDETISSHRAIDFFSSLRNQDSKLLLYTSTRHAYPDKRILTRESAYPHLNVKHFSHVSIPFSPENVHYGQHGDYRYASHLDSKNIIFGAYNRIESDTYNLFHKMKLIKHERRELTYNPDFNFMTDQIIQFITGQ